MSHEHCGHRCYFVFIASVFGILLGAFEATLWLFGLIPTVRQIVPYAAADAMLIFALTPVLAVFSRTRPPLPEEREKERRFPCLGKYVKTIMIAATVFLIFVQIFLGTDLVFTARAILAFIGSLSFWVMLVVFLAMVFTMVRIKQE